MGLIVKGRIMKQFNNLSDLSSRQWGRLQQVLDGFRAACQSAKMPDLKEFLPPPDEAIRRVALRELIGLELEEYRRRNLHAQPEQYVERFPEVGTVADLQSRFAKEFQDLSVPAAVLSEVHAAPAPEVDISQKYQKTERIGEGRYGEVWRGMGPDGVPVAIKIIDKPLDPDAVRREEQALNLIKNLDHPYLIKTHVFSRLNDRLYVIMELAGDSLQARLKACRKAGSKGLPVDELIGYMGHAAQGLDYLHAQSMLHRDVKSENLLLVDGIAKLADFGMIHLLDDQVQDPVSCAGTPMNIAPELWAADLASPQTDQYSLACTYVELRLGRHVFPQMAVREMMMAHLNDKPDLRGFSRAECRVLLQALAKKPEDRYRNCAEFAKALAQATARR